MRPVQTCGDCHDLGRVVMAVRVVGKTPVCDEHLRQRMGQPAIKVEEHKERTMPRAKEIDWDKVQRDRNQGATTTALAEKYGCSSPTICAHTKPSGNNHAGGKNERSPLAAEVTSKAARTARTRSSLRWRRWMLSGTDCRLKQRRSY
jgi:hypothetical protein